ncbi:MAG: hypothetical protein CL816_02660 [Coxiellaceae bacterium]|nr:hypothetical protein [Coxiellaceae bacterium]|tara:strand:- start:12855 stop:14192 length:1338 start_codon:yes stop_codon:yes gene_type:complete
MILRHLNETLLYAIIAIGCFATMYLFNTLLSNHLSPAFYGDIAFSMKVFYLLAIIVQMGKPKLVLKLVPVFHQKRHLSEIHLLQWCGFSLLINIIVYLIITALIFLSVYVFHSPNLHISKEVHIIIWFLPIISVYSFLGLILNAYQAYGFGLVEAFTNKMAPWLCLNILLLGTLLLVDQLKPIHVVFIYSCTYLILFFTTAVFLKRSTGNHAFFQFLDKTYLSESKQTLVRWKKDGIGFLGNSAISTALRCVALVVMETGSHLPGSKLDENSVGFFAAIQTIGAAGILLSQVSYTSFQAKLATYLASEKMQETANRENWKITRINILVSIAYITFIICFGKQILGVFGESFRTVYPELIITSFSTFFYTVSSISPSYLNFTNNIGLCNRIQVCSLLTYVIVGYTLGYFYGITGVCIASLCCWAFRATALHIIARKLTGHHPLGAF